jgi:hypothetical protein
MYLVETIKGRRNYTGKVCCLDILYHGPPQVFVIVKRKKVKVSHYTPWRRMGGEEV